MARKTKKYIAATSLALQLRIPPLEEAEYLYEDLQAKGYYWAAEKGVWLPAGDPAEARSVIRLRVWAETESCSQVANSIVFSLTGVGWQLIERSQPDPCRPPNQSQSRIYLTFKESEE